MELYEQILILCLLCVARAFEVPPEEIAEFGAGPLTYIQNLSKIPIQETDGIDTQSTENPRDKRALGVLLSGLAQIFGYTVTPVQFASLPNPNVTKPAAMPNMMPKVDVKQNVASSQPANTTVPRQQETIRFTGVLNLGNNSNILGHLQQYEQIFHGRQNNTMMMTTSRPASTLPAKIPMDLRTNLQTQQPLLAPFFVKIPLPLAPNLLPIDPVENLELPYPSPPVSVSDSNENVETPVRKEQETVYRSNEDTERYTVKEKDIYDEKDVKKPMNKYNHQLHIDELNKQQNNEPNELQRKQQEHIKNPNQEEEERHRDKADHYEEEEINERYRDHEEEIADRNRDVSKDESTEERRPTHHDEEDEGSVERHKEYANQKNLPNKQSPKQSPKDEKEENEDYHDDHSNKQFNGYKQPADFDKYVEIGYQQLPIGDYFHEGNPEVIRDSYGEVLDNKKLKDDRIADYVNMFKHPYVQTNAYDSQRVHNNPKDVSREENEETSAEDGYDEHLNRLQKLREEYALPENKYEEYDLNDENEADRNDRENLRIQNDTLRRPKKPGQFRDKEDDDVRLENAGSQEEADYGTYVPLVVPVRYIDANDKIQQATTRRLNYKEADKLTDSRFSENNMGPMQTIFKEQTLLTPQIGLPERPRQLHEGDHKEFQVWPPPFDYAFDNTEPAATIVPSNLPNYYPIAQNYAPNYYQHVVKKIAAQDANDKSSEQPSGYLVLVGNPEHPHRQPYNFYYFSNEAVNSQSQVPNPHAEVPRDPVYVAHQQSASEQIVQVKPNITKYNLNETTNSPYDYYYQPQEIPANVLDRYRYTFEERRPQSEREREREREEPFNIDIKSQILNTENWSNKIHRPQPPSNTAEQSLRPVFTLQNIPPLNRNAQSRSSERPRHSRLLRKRRSLHTEKENRKNNEEAKASQQTLTSKPFDNPQSAHDFFGFSKDDYNFGSESNNATKVVEENGKTTEESDAFIAPEPTAYHHDDESIIKQTDEPENDTEKAKVREYRNKVATLRVSEQTQLKPNGPIHYVEFIRNI
ncbi:PREDICTED: uncharacterized protein LOC108766306 [Trachymyrmex cornetzi]|uniref:Uncharacterized protein n=1 Tax=Trachymyrmex cornetzi TaxID=471704 RepID=A0A195DLP4_9HYME|nr:PREDICTED: uncharacterized protein LOC108766306 [Trachymyrmex cornetzi]KYN13815.1 hypothetical protein ALC57_13889 [Trachymyrmex cornetzi]